MRIEREDLRLFLTDGYLIFAKPVEGRRVAAYFYAETEAGDGEVLLVPPDAAERTTLSRFTGMPNLNEHIKGALLLFTDNTGDQLAAEISEKKFQASAEMGRMLANSHDALLKNLFHSFEIRLVSDFRTNDPKQGLFFAAMAGSHLGSFDVSYDPTSRDQITAGQVTFRNNAAYFDVWTSFPGRSVRRGLTPAVDFTSLLKTRHFDIQAEITADLKLKAVTKISIEPATPLDPLQFECSRQVRIISVKLNGREVEFFQRESLRSNLIRGREGDVFLVIPNEPLAAGKPAEIIFEHEADVIRPAGNGVYYVGARGSWYPQSGIQFATYNLTFRYPKALQVVSVGTTVEEKSDETVRITRRRVDQKIRMVGFNLGDYGKATESRAGLTVDVYANKKLENFVSRRQVTPMPQAAPTFPRRRAGDPQQGLVLDAPPPPQANANERAERLAGEIMEVFGFFRDKFGPAPVPQLEVSPVPGTFGQGFPGMIYLSTLTYLKPDERPAGVREQSMELFYSELLHAHEVAHQWWGNRVVAIGANDEWMMEAFASYSGLIQLEKKKGSKAMDSVLEDYRKKLLTKLPSGQTMESTGPIKLGIRLESSQAPDAWRSITYEKGSWILHMLRRRLGDAGFFALLKEICVRFDGKPLSTSDFKSMAVKYVPKGMADAKLEDFFEHWIYGTGVPEIDVKWKLEGKGSALKVVGTIHQKHVEDTFTTLVPVEVQFARGVKSRMEWIKTDGAEAEFEFKVTAAPVKILVDPSGWVLTHGRK